MLNSAGSISVNRANTEEKASLTQMLIGPNSFSIVVAADSTAS